MRSSAVVTEAMRGMVADACCTQFMHQRPGWSGMQVWAVWWMHE